MSRVVRILSTHDFFGCFADLPASYGTLSGGEGLRSTVDSLRTELPTLWVDSGDFSQGGPLSFLTSGEGGFLAAAELGIDVAAVGNHDLDFGVDLLKRHASSLGFPLLCANADLGLPSTTIVPTYVGDVGFIGITHRDLNSVRLWSMVPERTMPEQFLVPDIAALSLELRKQGACAVVLVVHDGIDWLFNHNNEYEQLPSSFLTRCEKWSPEVDLIVAGHTQGRFFGQIGGVPILQPWPFGAELGAIELDLASTGQVGTPRSILVKANGPWQGYGSELIRAAEEDIVGVLPNALEARSTGAASLAEFLAHSIHAVANADVSFAYTSCGQPTLDGVFSYFPKGILSKLQLLQVVPYTNFRIVETEIERSELIKVRSLIGRAPQSRTTAWHDYGEVEDVVRSIRIATTAGAAASVIGDLLCRDMQWTDLGTDLFDGVREVLKGTK